MDSHQIVLGFSELKTELRTKLKINKQQYDLHLWFSERDGEVYMHDNDNHNACLILALQNPENNSWRIFLKPKSYKYDLIFEVVNTVPLREIQDHLNALFRSHGFFRLRRGQ
jgi:hypothetical protein